MQDDARRAGDHVPLTDAQLAQGRAEVRFVEMLERAAMVFPVPGPGAHDDLRAFPVTVCSADISMSSHQTTDCNECQKLFQRTRHHYTKVLGMSSASLPSSRSSVIFSPSFLLFTTPSVVLLLFP